mmetsp:Transcript_4023/g.9897  ORF Transcript_4023/g.9897 Transcript_4023/m.9897 type:complete len:205 (-) Transcript_4023:166-780(-)
MWAIPSFRFHRRHHTHPERRKRRRATSSSEDSPVWLDLLRHKSQSMNRISVLRHPSNQQRHMGHFLVSLVVHDTTQDWVSSDSFRSPIGRSYVHLRPRLCIVVCSRSSQCQCQAVVPILIYDTDALSSTSVWKSSLIVQNRRHSNTVSTSTEYPPLLCPPGENLLRCQQRRKHQAHHPHWTSSCIYIYIYSSFYFLGSCGDSYA